MSGSKIGESELIDQRQEKAEGAEKTLRWANAGSLVFAVLQSLCVAVMTLSGVSTLLGVGALVAATGVYTLTREFHQDAIRIPMMLVALAGALANLYSVWRVRSLRARPAAQWRVKPVSKEKLNAERLQIGLAVLTLVLLAVEQGMHSFIHHHHPV